MGKEIMNYFYLNTSVAPWMILLVVWELVWKGLGLWKAARNNQSYWFVAILIFNTLGILPILYIQFFKKTK